LVETFQQFFIKQDFLPKENAQGIVPMHSCFVSVKKYFSLNYLPNSNFIHNNTSVDIFLLNHFIFR
jgi:hypothetical protein